MSYFRMVYPTLSSAMTRFTVLFEMGRSGTKSLLSPSIFGLTDGKLDKVCIKSFILRFTKVINLSEA